MSNKQPVFPPILKLLQFAALGFALTGLAGVSAKEDQYEENFDHTRENDPDSDKLFGDPSKILPPGQVKLPSFPQPRQLIRLRSLDASTLTVLVDKSSVRRDKAGAVQIAYVVESSSGARNYFFEGLLCPDLYTSYAFGSIDRVWSKVESQQWRQISDASINNFRRTLMELYVCNALGQARHPRDIVLQMYEGISSPDNEDY